jgi:probable rRNA maturation factor
MPEFLIDVQSDHEVLASNGLDEATRGLLESTVVATLEHEAVTPPAALTVVLSNDEQIRQLNRDFRGLDEVTDVLSFSAGTPMPGAAHRTLYLGDVVISTPYAARQAVAGGHGLIAELQLLAIHGVLHLLGHDHAEVEEKKRMWAVQAAILTRLGIQMTMPAGE